MNGVSQISKSAATPVVFSPERLTAIDALRGLAALLVLLPHFVGFFGLLGPQSGVGRIMLALGEYGHSGVDVFFVLSGFVMTFTTQGRPMSLSGTPRFMLRRLARLAPPYWVSLALMLSVLSLQSFMGPSHQWAPSVGELWPSLCRVIAHLFYAQDLLSLGNINAVYWTLCIEVQFYLIYAVVMVGLRAAERQTWACPAMGIILLGVSWLASIALLWNKSWRDALPPGTFLPYWHEFALGILACRLINHASEHWGKILAVIICVIGVAMACWLPHAGLLTAILAFGLIWQLGQHRRLGTALNYPSLQYLGKISYSLYLVHVPVGVVILGISTRLGRNSVTADFLFFFFAIVCSLLAAHIFYLTIERHATVFSRRFKPI